MEVTLYLKQKAQYCLDKVFDLPGSSASKEPTCNAGDPGSIPGSKRSLGERNGNPPQYSCLENPMDRGAWWATVHEVAKVGYDLATETKKPNHLLALCISISSLENGDESIYLVTF